MPLLVFITLRTMKYLSLGVEMGCGLVYLVYALVFLTL